MIDVGKQLQDAYDEGYKQRNAEIVRCKDCKNYKLFSLFVGGKGIGVCTKPFRLYACWIDVDEDDFCSRGERKEK